MVNSYVPRQLEEQIRPFLKRREALAIVGPRQAGKTTFLKHLYENMKKGGRKVKFLTFENRGDLVMFQESLDDFKALAEEYSSVIIDEFQYAKNGGQKLKYLYDTTKTKFIISGSSSLELTFETGKYMVGRLLDFKLMPFSFREFLSVENKELSDLLNKKIDPRALFSFNVRSGFGAEINRRLAGALEKYVIFGGYPAVVLAKSGAEKQKLLEGILEKYLLRDIKGLLNLATDEELLTLSKFLAAQTGGMVNFAELSNASGLTYKDVLKHLRILEKTYIIEMIKPFFTSRRTELVKNPKPYFIDSGIRNFLLSDFRPAAKRNDLGAMMENYARGALANLDLAPRIKYWRTKSKAEVDFIIEKEGSVYPVEVKYVSKRLVGKSMFSFIEKFKPPTALILTKDYLGEEKIGNTKIKFVPLTYL